MQSGRRRARSLKFAAHQNESPMVTKTTTIRKALSLFLIPGRTLLFCFVLNTVIFYQCRYLAPVLYSDRLILSNWVPAMRDHLSRRRNAGCACFADSGYCEHEEKKTFFFLLLVRARSKKVGWGSGHFSSSKRLGAPHRKMVSVGADPVRGHKVIECRARKAKASQDNNR